MKISIILAICYLVLAPFIGGLLEGIDRKLSARMQRRVGPPVLQPFYDVIKLFNKENQVVYKSQSWLIVTYFVLMVLTGVMFFAGFDLLMCFFVMSTSATFLYFAACVTGSPYSTIGGHRELLQMTAYEPAVLLACVGFYLATGSFDVITIATANTSAIKYLPGFFIAFVFILTIKMRKSPFDTSASHHPHQELVKGLTTEFSGKNLALFQVSEWYENVFLLGVVGLFIINSKPVSIIVTLVVVFLTFFLEVLIDNSNGRMKWQQMLKITWIVTIVTAGVNTVVLMFIN
ncbi:MAG: NADH-quinone oxidoreductase subunit H [Lachnospiraceae bacterium]|nr:NADH-quinone oxidoreductase subunit H [Lachnospiraceae bacterium]